MEVLLDTKFKVLCVQLFWGSGEVGGNPFLFQFYEGF